MIQRHKKEGLGEAEHEFLSPEKAIFLRGIPKHLVRNSKVDLEHLLCEICGQIIWKVVTCGQPACFGNFCEYCVSNYSQSACKDDEVVSRCPKCAKPFQRTSIPLMNNLLSELNFRCFNHDEGCEETISYDGYLKHALSCDYRKVLCPGCQTLHLQKLIKDHQTSCSFIVVSCSKCELRLPQADFKRQHSEVHCLERQLQAKTTHIDKLEESVERLKGRLNQYESLMEKIIKGENLQLSYQLYSSFPANFLFNGSQVRLTKSSWNANKQKYDFLHFYVTSPIKTESPVGYQWKLLVKSLKGNLLIGICSSLLISSVDFVINRFGQIKKKESNQNKYKLVRKGNLTFSQGDIISFRYLALRKDLKIENETKKVECRLDGKETSELGQNLYSFYSLDTVNDTIKFI